MSRAKTGFVRRRKHKKILNETKGYWGSRSKLYRRANEAYLKAGEYAFDGRKAKKKDARKLWIMRLNATVRAKGISYSVFVHKLQKSGLQLDRKVLSELAVSYPATFDKVFEKVTAEK